MLEKDLEKITNQKKSRKGLMASFCALFLMLSAKVIYGYIITHFNAVSPFAHLIPVTYLMIFLALSIAIIVAIYSLAQFKISTRWTNYVALFLSLLVISSCVYDFSHNSIL